MQQQTVFGISGFAHCLHRPLNVEGGWRQDKKGGVGRGEVRKCRRVRRGGAGIGEMGMCGCWGGGARRAERKGEQGGDVGEGTGGIETGTNETEAEVGTRERALANCGRWTPTQWSLLLG